METATVVCVLGMHRSGTSAVAKVLSLLGIDLGPPQRLFRPHADNPEGFLEHMGFVEVSEEILARLGGCWHEPPAFVPGWERSPELSDLRMRAAALIREDFSGRALWGWKDPRACLTLPFWRTLLPPTRYVLCIRSPLSVARSLEKRDGFSIEKSGRLWLTHVTSALTNSAGNPRLIMAYEDVLTARDQEVQRLARFVGRPDLAEVRSAIQESLRHDLQHHRASLEDTVTERRLPFPARALYAELHLAVSHHRDSPGEVDEEEDEVLTLLARVSGEDQAAGFEAQHRHLLADHHRLALEREQLRTDLTRRQSDLTRRQSHLTRLQSHVTRLQSHLARSQEALAKVQGHPVWRAYHWLRSGLLPGGSRREVAYLRTRRWLEARRRTDR
jgi:hypothetical protein